MAFGSLASTFPVKLAVVDIAFHLVEVTAEIEAEEAKELSLHLVDFPERKEVAANNSPTLVGVAVIHGHLGSEHECREKESVRGRLCSSGRRVACLQALEIKEGLMDDGFRKARAVDGIGDELC